MHHPATPTLPLLNARFRRVRGGGERASNIIFIRLGFAEGGVIRETHVAQSVVACVVALVPEFLQTLEVENSEKLWIILFPELALEKLGYGPELWKTLEKSFIIDL